MMPKKTQGRRKIQMAKMEKESNLMVTFSKRRSGLFKKASELSILCGVEIAIIAFSPRNKNAFSFGHPSVERIVDRFLTQNPEPYSSTSQLIDAHRNANIYYFNTQLTYAMSQLEIEKKKSEELTKVKEEGSDNHWWKAPIESQGLEELEQFKAAMGWLQNNIEEQKNRTVAANYPLPIFPNSGPNGSGEYNQVMGSGHDMTMNPHEFKLGFGRYSG